VLDVGIIIVKRQSTSFRLQGRRRKKASLILRLSGGGWTSRRRRRGVLSLSAKHHDRKLIRNHSCDAGAHSVLVGGNDAVWVGRGGRGTRADAMVNAKMCMMTV
jgi:hypothetical protein